MGIEDGLAGLVRCFSPFVVVLVGMMEMYRK